MKFNKKLLRTFSLILFLFAVLITACKKDDSAAMPAANQRLSLYLTDDPSPYDSVLIDIKYVEKTNEKGTFDLLKTPNFINV